MKRLLMGLFALFLVGCASTPNVQVLTQQLMTEITLDQETLKLFPPVPPPIQEEYTAMSTDEKEDTLTRFALQLMNQNAVYRINIESIVSLIQKQNAVIRDYNQKEEARVKKLKQLLEAGN